MIQLKTERLMLRQWDIRDLAPFAHLNADVRVMKYFPSILSREESDLFALKLAGSIDQKGWGLWAVELRENHQFIGFIGLQSIPFFCSLYSSS